MSFTGPGCPACDYRGRVPIGEAAPFAEYPCGACSPYSHGPDFPGADLRAKAVAIRKHGDADPRMTAWALRLLGYADEVDAERAAAPAPPDDNAVLSYGSDNAGGLHLCLGDARIHLSAEAVTDLAAGLMAEASRPSSPAPKGTTR